MLRRLASSRVRSLLCPLVARAHASRREWVGTGTVAVLAATAVSAAVSLSFALDDSAQCEEAINGVPYATGQSVTNWSSTHVCNPSRFYEPRTAQEVVRLLQYLHRKRGERARPVGTALSPNGIALSDAGESLISLHALDSIRVDPARQVVTVGAGARVSDVLKALDVHGLTLENFSSIQEQAMAGWTQVAAHGTGCSLPTVEEMIVHMQVATATSGLLSLSAKQNPELFSMAKVGLGVLGVVTELTLRCIPKYSLREHTYTLAPQTVAQSHRQRLRDYRHVRYMWLPYANETVVVVSNPVNASAPQTEAVQPAQTSAAATALPTKPLYELLMTLEKIDEATASKLTFSQLRDRLLDSAPLDLAHVQRVNRAEAQFWAASTGTREDDSTKILGFDCGGEQLVFEVCFPIGDINDSKNTRNKDIEFVHKLLKVIETHKIPAHCPIEQRWTSSSSAEMSPAHSANAKDVFSWVGVIMYLPPHQSPEQREAIRQEFERYRQAMQPLLDEYQAHAHWAKIELPREGSTSATTTAASAGGWFWSAPAAPAQSSESILKRMQERVRERYPVDRFNSYRRAIDPMGVLSNELVDKLFGK